MIANSRKRKKKKKKTHQFLQMRRNQQSNSHIQKARVFFFKSRPKDCSSFLAMDPKENDISEMTEIEFKIDEKKTQRNPRES